MIPFARMMIYGNKVKGTQVRNMEMAMTHLTILDSDGALTFYGTNNYGSMGLGSTSTTLGWFDGNITDVDSIWHNNTNVSVAIKKDGTVWMCGAWRGTMFGTPNLGTTPSVSWVEITDRLTFNALDVAQVIIAYSFCTFLLKNGDIYSTDSTLGGTVVTNPNGYTGWRVSRYSTRLVKLATYSDVQSYGNVYTAIDVNGKAYGIGSDTWKQVTNGGSGTITSWTPTLASYTVTDIIFGGNFNAFLTSDGRVFYSGISGVINPANINNTVNSYAVVGAGIASRIFSTGSGLYHIRQPNTMWGSFGNNQAPIANSNALNTTQHNVRTMPLDNILIEYLFCTVQKNMVVIYFDSSTNKRRMFCIGPIANNNNALTFAEIDFPTKYT